MSPEAQMILQGLLFAILTIVGLLLVWLHFRLQELIEARKKMPLLADNLTEIMLKARVSISQLMTGVSEQVPELEHKLHDSQKVLQEFDYVLDRANKILERLDGQLEKVKNQGVDLAIVPSAKAEQKPLQEQKAPQKESTVTPLRPAVAAAYNAGAIAQIKDRATSSDAEDELRRALAQRL